MGVKGGGRNQLIMSSKIALALLVIKVITTFTYRSNSRLIESRVKRSLMLN